MQQTYFITGTDTSVGKTVLTALLARFLAEQGVKVAAFKPICSGGRDDALVLHEALGGTVSLEVINPWYFRAAIAPSLAAQLERKSVSLAKVLAHIRTRRKGHDAALVEGAGGLRSPLGRDFDSRDLLVALRATPIIVAPNKLGVINHLLLTLEALPKGCRRAAKIVLMQPAKPDSATASNVQLLKCCFPARNIFTLPWLGAKGPPAKAFKMPPVRRTLRELIGT